MSVASGSRNFQFSTPVAQGGRYNVTILTQPVGKTCTVSNGSGIATSNVTNVLIVCEAANYTIGGTVSGLTSAGLILQNNHTDTLPVPSGASTFEFSQPVIYGETYLVTVLSSPPGLTCSANNNSGTVTGTVTTVVITCSTSSYTIGGTISPSSPPGLVLQNNGADNLAVATGATTFTFSDSVAMNANYSVTVFTQPSGYSCVVTNGQGTVTGNVTSVLVTCTALTYTVGGSISGLTASGLVLENNGTDTLSVNSGATTFTFNQQYPSGSPYHVTVLTQPVGLTCSTSNNTGTVTGNVHSVLVTCSPQSYTIGGTITGLSGAGLVLLNNGTDNLSIPSGDTSFTFPQAVAYGSQYSVTVLTNPSGLTCTASSNTGTVTANVTSVVITCDATSFTIGGSITGLTTTGLSLKLNNDSRYDIASGATTYTFPSSVAFDSHYAVSIATQPTGSTCSVSNATGGPITANVTNVDVTCIENYALILSQNNFITQCIVDSTGKFFLSCTDAGAGSLNQPTGIAINATNTHAYISNNDPNGQITICALTLGNTPLLSNCHNMNMPNSLPALWITLSPDGTIAYVGQNNSSDNLVLNCPILPDGDLGACIESGPIGLPDSTFYMDLNNSFSMGYLPYAADCSGTYLSQAIYQCPISGGDFGMCSLSLEPQPAQLDCPSGLALNPANSYIFITNRMDTYITQCSIISNSLTNCDQPRQFI